jgi:hypothetical protein
MDASGNMTETQNLYYWFCPKSWMDYYLFLYSNSRLSGADTVNGGLPKILDGLVYISLLEQLGVRKK